MNVNVNVKSLVTHCQWHCQHSQTTGCALIWSEFFFLDGVSLQAGSVTQSSVSVVAWEVWNTPKYVDPGVSNHSNAHCSVPAAQCNDTLSAGYLYSESQSRIQAFLGWGVFHTFQWSVSVIEWCWEIHWECREWLKTLLSLSVTSCHDSRVTILGNLWSQGPGSLLFDTWTLSSTMWRCLTISPRLQGWAIQASYEYSTCLQ